METSKIGYWLQVGANVGLLAGLILVALQLNQADFLTRNQLLSDQLSDRMNTMGSMLGENPAETIAKAVMQPEELTDAELIIMDSWMSREMISARRVKELADSGIYPEEVWNQHRTVIDYALASRFGRTWWDLARDQYLQSDPDFVEVVDSVLESLPPDDDWDDFLARLKLAFRD